MNNFFEFTLHIHVCVYLKIQVTILLMMAD